MKALLDRYYRALGQIVYHFSQLEARVRWAIASMGGAESYESTEIIASAVPFRRALDILAAQLKHALPHTKVHKSFGRLASRARECEAVRNRYIHSLWEPYKRVRHGRTIYTIKRSKPVFRDADGYIDFVESTTPAQISREATRIRRLNADFSRFFTSLDWHGFPVPFDGDPFEET